MKISWSEMEIHKKDCRYGVIERKREKKLIQERKREEEIERQRENQDRVEQGIQEFQRVHESFLDMPMRIGSRDYRPMACNVQ